MKKGFLILLALILVGCGGTTHKTKTTADRRSDPEKIRTLGSIHCGVELWPIKVMSDPLASKVNLSPQLTTVDAINSLPTPSNPSTRQGDSFELQTWAVQGYLTGYKKEADNDIHAVLQSKTTNKTLIIEFPNANCDRGSVVKTQIDVATTAFLTEHPVSKSCFDCLHELVLVSGVGFFDHPHGQHGVADNAAELHPVTSYTPTNG